MPPGDAGYHDDGSLHRRSVVAESRESRPVIGRDPGFSKGKTAVAVIHGLPLPRETIQKLHSGRLAEAS